MLQWVFVLFLVWVFFFFFFFFPSCSSGFSLYFRFALYFAFDFHMYFGLWVSFWDGCSGFLAGFEGVCWVGVLSGQAWMFNGGFFCFLGSRCFGCSLWVSGFRVDPYEFVWVFSFCGLALAVHVYTPDVLKGA